MQAMFHMLVLATLVLTACGADVNDRDASAGAERAAEADLPTIVMTVPSMSCPLCVRSIRARLEEAGLADIRIDLESKVVRARFDPARITAAEVGALVEGQGFPVAERRLVEVGEAEGRGPS